MPKRKLERDYTYKGQLYEAGPSVDVPEGFKAGNEIKPKPRKKPEPKAENAK